MSLTQPSESPERAGGKRRRSKSRPVSKGRAATAVQKKANYTHSRGITTSIVKLKTYREISRALHMCQYTSQIPTELVHLMPIE